MSDVILQKLYFALPIFFLQAVIVGMQIGWRLRYVFKLKDVRTRMYEQKIAREISAMQINVGSAFKTDHNTVDLK